MKKALLFFIITLYSAITYCQKAIPNEFIALGVGQSKHGTGDIKGIAFNTFYQKKLRKNLSLVVTFGGTLHDDSRELFYASPTGEDIDGSIRYVTGGIQSTVGINYSFIQTFRSDFYVGLNALFRYQATSYYDVVTILYPIVTDLPIPVIYFENLSPARTFTVGGTTRLGYNYLLNNRFVLGIYGDFQIDFNGDVLSQIGILIGKRL